ncbi:MAG TPA: tetratricopeptide repeat protein [Limnobacter sp.]|uniref:nuclear transport factor 2 family protein n=1 Tax=Limnobacter sp. TaxID=2003368 RepID=UPI002ED79CC9
MTNTHKKPRNTAKTLLVCALMGLALAGGPSRADEADEVSKLIQQNQYDRALARADAYLANRPNDAQMRFLKGLILTERGKTNEAITIFTKLTEDYPELPEPYNNLAVLYAGRGDYEKAREALEMAIRTHPSYATAHENLGDVYAKLASQSYDKALQLDGRNQTAQTKLALVRNLIAGKTPDTLAAATPVNTAKGKTTVAAAAAPTPAPTPAPAAAPEPAPTPAPVAPIVTATAKVPAAAATVAAAATTLPSISASTPGKEKPSNKPTLGTDTEVLNAVERWAKAWTEQDIKTYLASYSQDFDTPGKMSRENWEKMREQRIVGKESIRVVVDNPLITISGDEATVKFKQSYFSNRLNNVSNKTLTLKLENGAWRITSERVGG